MLVAPPGLSAGLGPFGGAPPHAGKSARSMATGNVGLMCDPQRIARAGARAARARDGEIRGAALALPDPVSQMLSPWAEARRARGSVPTRERALPAYDAQLSGFHRAFEPELQQIVDALPLTPAMKVLDLACGDGFYTRRIADRLG